MVTTARLLAAAICSLAAGGARAGIYEALFGASGSICTDASQLVVTCSCPREESRLYQGADCSDRDIDELPLQLQLPLGVPVVSFEKNRLAVVREDQFALNGRVKTLRLSGNRIQAVEPLALAGLPELETLLLDGNQLVEIDSTAFRGLSALVQVDLSFNRLRSLPPELFAGTAVRQLKLDYNPLVALDPGLLLHLPRLRLLDLDSTDLTQLPAGLFASSRQLETLLLPHNQLTEVPAEALSLVADLRTLDLSGNRLSSLPADGFRSVPNLRRLVLSSMRSLRSVDAHAFSGLVRLEELLCQFNEQLTSVDPTAFRDSSSGEFLPQLTSVDLKENGLTRIASDLLPWERMAFVDLEMNPWNCDCEMDWIAEGDYLFENEPLFKCAQPEGIAGNPVTILTAQEFVCENKSGNIALVVFLALLGVALVVGVAYLLWKFQVCQRAKSKLFVRPKYGDVRREKDRVGMDGMEWDTKDIGV